MVYYESSYNPEFDINCTTEESKIQALEENNRAVELYRDGLSLYNSGHYSDAISKFLWAKSIAHDREVISDCNEMIDECNEALAELYMR